MIRCVVRLLRISEMFHGLMNNPVLMHTAYKGSFRTSQRTRCVCIIMSYVLKHVYLFHGRTAVCGAEHGGTQGGIGGRDLRGYSRPVHRN